MTRRAHERDPLLVRHGRRGARGAVAAAAAGPIAVAILTWALAAACSGLAPPDRTLHVGVAADPYPPFVDAGGGGFSRAVAERLAEDLGFRAVRFVPFEWPDLGAAARRGDFDVAISGITWRPERAVVGYTSRALAAGGPCLVGDADGGRVAVNRGGVLEAWARERFAGRELRTVDDNDELPGLLAAGEVDAFVTDSFEAPHFRRPQDALDCAPPVDRKVIWLVPRAASLGEAVDRWVRQSEPWLREQRSRHFGAAMPRDDLDHLIDLVARRLALMPYVAAWKRARGAAIEDSAREAVVLDAVREAAHSRGLEPEGVAAFFAVQIELAKALQEREPSAPAVLDLTAELRPLLSRIGDEIVAALAVAAPIRQGALDDPARWAPVAQWLTEEELERVRGALAAVRVGAQRPPEMPGARTNKPSIRTMSASNDIPPVGVVGAVPR